MEWSEEGIVLRVRPHGEGGVILDALARQQGRHAGLVRGGASRRMAGALQPGNRLQLTWRARVSESLGTFTFESVDLRAAHFFADKLKLSALSAVLALANVTLPEREAHPRVHDGLEALIRAIDHDLPEVWLPEFVRWEMTLLEDLGFGLDLSACAATGETEGLTFVSPRSHKAVSAAAGAPFRDKLLRLPGFLLTHNSVTLDDVNDGFALTGFFLDRLVLIPHSQAMPQARIRFIEHLRGAKFGAPV